MELCCSIPRDKILAIWLLLLLGHVCARVIFREVRNTCQLPEDTGKCKAIIPRWYHNTYTKICEKFNYGGCGGNKNNFQSEKECDKTCKTMKYVRDVCLLPSDVGLCGAHLTRWYHNQYTLTCEEFNYGGCGGNANNFKSETECEMFCERIRYSGEFCQLPTDVGKCKAIVPRWYHNKHTETCEEFNYGGCRGNANNFRSEEQCKRYCPRIKESKEVCLLPANSGECKAIIPRWFYDRSTQTCEKFNYGGCGGNANNFRSEKECSNTCQMLKISREDCLLPSEVGECKAIIPRWYYDRSTQTCKRFNYGGCGGNANNFESVEECEKSCQMIERVPKKCRLDKDFGPCHGCFPAYFFNLSTMKCEQFCYSQCLGNENRFSTQSSCMQHCLPKRHFGGGL